MRTLKISFLVFILSISISAQEGWFWQNPLPQGNIIRNVKFVSTLQGWAVQDYNKILSTTNGGTTWEISTVVQQANKHSKIQLSPLAVASKSG